MNFKSVSVGSPKQSTDIAFLSIPLTVRKLTKKKNIFGSYPRAIRNISLPTWVAKPPFGSVI